MIDKRNGKNKNCSCWKCNFPINLPIRLLFGGLVCWSVGWSINRSVIISLHFNAPIGAFVLTLANVSLQKVSVLVAEARG